MRQAGRRWSFYAQGEAGLVTFDPFSGLKPGNNETKSPTRKPDAWATQFISLLGVRATHHGREDTSLARARRRAEGLLRLGSMLPNTKVRRNPSLQVPATISARFES